jgi:subtilisin family serine protease
MIIDNVTDPRAGQNVVIAVIDYGIDYLPTIPPAYHEDLSDNVWRDYQGKGGLGFKWNWITQRVEEVYDHRDDPDSGNVGHGTHVCGTSAAVDNDIGVIGTAPKALIYMLKLVTGDSRELVVAVNYAANMGQVSVIVMSLGLNGSATNPPGLENACMNAYNSGKLIFAASGNDNRSVIDYPARYDCVVAVGAVFENLSRWVNWTTGQGSNYGPELDFVAPGVDINSTWVNWGYRNDIGTSMACPHVGADAAMIWGSKPDPDFDVDHDGWERDEVLAKLYNQTLHLPNYTETGRNDEYGYGLVNAWRASHRPLGDITMDYKVRVDDVFMAAQAYGSNFGGPNWNPRADVNIDNKVRVDDVLFIADRFGDTDP